MRKLSCHIGCIRLRPVVLSLRLRNELACGIVGLLLFSAAPVSAQFEQPYLKYLEPITIEKGGDAELSFGAENAGAVRDVIFYQPGFESEALPGGKIKVSAGHELNSGLYPLSILGQTGVSNARYILIDESPSVKLASLKNLETRGVRTYSGASVGDMIEGHYDAGKHYRFSLQVRAGVPVKVACIAAALGSRMRPVLSIRDKNGRLLVRSLDGGLLSYRSRSDGEIFIEIRDQTYDGGREYFFCMKISEGDESSGVWDRLAAMSRHPMNGSVTTLPGNILEMAITDIVSELDSTNGVASHANGENVDWGQVPVNKVGDSGLENIIHCRMESGAYGVARLEFERGGKYQIQSVAHRVGMNHLVDIKLVELALSGETEVIQEVATIARNQRKYDRPLFGKFHTVHYDMPIEVDVKDGGHYGLVIGKPSGPGNKLRGQENDLDVRILIERSSHERANIVAIPEYPPNKDPNSRNRYPMNLNLVKGERVKAKLHAVRSGKRDGVIMVSFPGLPAGVHVYPAKVRFEKGEIEKEIVIEASLEASGGVGVVLPEVSFAGEDSGMGTHQFYTSSGPMWKIGDYNNEPSEYKVVPGMPVFIDDEIQAPLILGAEIDLASPVQVKLGEKNEIKISLKRDEKIKDLELVIKDRNRESKMPEVKVGKGVVEAVVVIDPAKMKWKPGSYSPEFVVELKHKFRDRQNSDKTKEKEYTFFARCQPVAIEVIE